MRHMAAPPGAAELFLGEGGEVSLTEKEWYNNKELYEMQVGLSKKMEALSAELGKTQVMIREYNGLRERLDRCEQRVDQVEGAAKGSRDMWGYVVGGIGLLLALISYVVR